APGCQVTVALPSGDTTAPASVACATAEPVTAAGTGAGATAAVVGARGTGAALTAAVVGAGGEVEPPLPVAVTTSEIVAPMSPGESVYDAAVAPRMAVHCDAVPSQRRHW